MNLKRDGELCYILNKLLLSHRLLTILYDNIYMFKNKVFVTDGNGGLPHGSKNQKADRLGSSYLIG